MCNGTGPQGIAMIIEAISGAASIALASAIFVLLLVKTARVASVPLSRSSRFPKAIMIEAAQRFRDEVGRLASERTIYITGSLVFITSFLVAFLLQPQQIFGGLPMWKHAVLLLVVAFAFSCMVYRLSRVAVDARRLEFIRDACIATGHSLQKLTANQNRVFHDVACADGYIDHVVVGLHGIYAVKVVAKRPGKDNRVRLKGDELGFAPGKEWASLSRFRVKVKQLSVQFRKQVGHEVHVRMVIAVPGWEVVSQSSEDYLVVNESNLVMMSGWKDPSDYLLDEDVEQIHDYLNGISVRDRNR
jgi:hypothetical protein